MYKFLFSIIVATIAMSVVGCKNDPLKGFEKMPLNYYYKNHTNKKGAMPKVGDMVSFHQYIRKGDSLVQSTRQMGQTINAQIPEGNKNDKFLNAVLRMSVGDSVTIAMVVDSLGQVRPPFKPGEMIFFDLKMEKVQTKEAVAKEQEAVMQTATAANAILKAQTPNLLKGSAAVKTTASGLKYIIAEEGKGEQVKAGNKAKVAYIGVLKDGTEFDSSFKHGGSFDFQVGSGQVIKGWDEGVALLKEGTKAVFLIPYALAYGEQGQRSIPAKSDLVFYIEVLKAK